MNRSSIRRRISDVRRQKLYLVVVSFFCLFGVSCRDGVTYPPLSRLEAADTMSSIAKTSDTNNVTSRIDFTLGDFDGDNTQDTAFAEILSVKDLESSEDGEQVVLFNIHFSEKGLLPFVFSANHEDVTLINEGDLDGKPGDEFSIYSPPLHGCMYTLYVYHREGGSFKEMMEPVFVPSACDGMEMENVQSRIFKNADTVFYLMPDPNDTAAIPAMEKRKAILK